MKRFFHTFLTAAAFALFFLVQPHAASASLQYLDDDPNYPVSYYHANYREYVDLRSCTFSAEGRRLKSSVLLRSRTMAFHARVRLR